MKIIAVTNIKGGVGKTTTAVNLAFLSAAVGRATVLWDLDPQAAATYMLRCEAGERVSAKKLIAGKRELPEVVVPSEYPKLDMLPSDLSYRNVDVHLNERKHPTERLLKMSRSLRSLYAALFLDCPPGISLLSENVLRAADAVVVPLLPTHCRCACWPNCATSSKPTNGPTWRCCRSFRWWTGASRCTMK
jgi:cellulose biosynthesis protein BcsQ